MVIEKAQRNAALSFFSDCSMPVKELFQERR